MRNADSIINDDFGHRTNEVIQTLKTGTHALESSSSVKSKSSAEIASVRFAANQMIFKQRSHDERKHL